MSASIHWRTPSLSVSDGRGLPVRQVAYLRTVAGDTPSALVTRQHHDVAGRLVAQQDPRLPIANTTSVFALNDIAVFTNSQDSGWRLLLPGRAGEPGHRWDERGHVWQSTFDEQLRVVQLEVSGNGENQLDTFTYAPGSAEADSNLRGRLIRQTDPSGSLDITGYALTGQALVEKRTFHDNVAFTSHQVFSPLGAVLEQTDAGGHRRASRYGLAGQLRQMELQVETKVTQVMLDAQYNANNQIISQLAGNGVLSQWTYDPADGRLHTRTSQKTAQPRLQDLQYFYDRAGNIIRIEDHAFEPLWFANQRVDGHREFSYDSLYRLVRATGHDDALPPDIPGLPRPPDEKNRLNYTQTYSYDDGGNLIELRHQRDGNSRTRTMRIDQKSNRGVRWQTGDEPPDFGIWFDPHGNQRKLRHGPSLQWSRRDELERVDLVIRQDSDNDAEYYQYSAGQRVLKCHEWFTDKVRHFHQVRYLPGLEIRRKDNGEELHIISLGNARCLHWAQRAVPIDDQIRYTLEDHLGSCVMELNEDAVVTSAEGYYPFGETAWMAPESEIEYRFIRYSGKEMDVSGLYYYGARYYAPWLQRWVSADPAGDVDGLNLYGFVGNNPILFIDNDGNKKDLPSDVRQDIATYAKVLDNLGNELQTYNRQLNGLFSATDISKRMAINTGFNIGKGVVTTTAGKGGEALGTLILPGVGTFIGGIVASKISGAAIDKLGEITTVSTPLLPDAKKLNPESIHSNATTGILTPLRYAKKIVRSYDPRTSEGANKLIETVAEKTLSKFAQIPAASDMMAIAYSGKDTATALAGLRDIEIDDLETALGLIIDMLEQDQSDINAAFSEIGVNEFYDQGLVGSFGYALDLAKGSVGTQNSSSISRDRIKKEISLRMAEARRGIELIGRYRQYNGQKTA
ncbi:RHS repeat domain-containing protein [Pseudomonas atacamensis]|uniref:RHS repeat domain-containing protein n=1 Tax=Pseudomonas atacamensis TaxID=2565368 RepID=UPI0024810818|nr:RHS repeat-associated core domain-containing protein [Pseudomonas atacamensis]WGT34519.1 RHS repeat-associated core domain-containing protein [Pseudomonas atacamensis]